MEYYSAIKKNTFESFSFLGKYTSVNSFIISLYHLCKISRIESDDSFFNICLKSTILTILFIYFKISFISLHPVLVLPEGGPLSHAGSFFAVCQLSERTGSEVVVATYLLQIHSRILAWKIPGTEVPCGLQPMMWQRVGHD